MRWIELGLRFGLIGLLFTFQMILHPGGFPILELCVILIFCTSYLLADGLSLPIKFLPAHIYLIYYAGFFAASFFLPGLFYYWPVVLYERSLRSAKHVWFFLPLLVTGNGQPLPVYLFVLGFSVMSSVVHTVLQRNQTFVETSYNEIDTLRHLNERFRKEQDHLLSLQDERVHSTMMKERKRIVEEIHDTLGHQLSSAIIQIGALQYLVENPAVKQSLTDVKNTLDTSMHNVRSIIHTERETVVDLESELQQLVEKFTKCAIHFQYEVHSPPDSQTAHSFVNIVKEGLANINKHSNATSVQLRLTEWKNQWALLLADNGSVDERHFRQTKGIGLMNIEERVDKLGGKLHINVDNGFRIFITIPIDEEEVG